MRGLQERLERAPLGAVFGVTSSVFLVFRLVTDALTGRDVLVPILLIVHLVGAALFGGVMTLVIARQRRRGGGASTSADITRAVKDARLPLHADPAVWIPALEWRRGRFRRSLHLTPIVLGIVAVLGVVSFALDPTLPLGLVAALVLVGLAVGVTIQARRTLPRIDALLEQLRARPEPSAVDAAAPGRDADR